LIIHQPGFIFFSVFWFFEISNRFFFFFQCPICPPPPAPPWQGGKSPPCAAFRLFILTGEDGAGRLSSYFLSAFPSGICYHPFFPPPITEKPFPLFVLVLFSSAPTFFILGPPFNLPPWPELLYVSTFHTFTLSFSFCLLYLQLFSHPVVFHSGPTQMTVCGSQSNPGPLGPPPPLRNPFSG